MLSGRISRAVRGPNIFAQTPEAADHLVGDHKHIVAIKHRLDLREVPRRRPTTAPPAPITGSAMKAATVSGPLAQDLLLELGGETGGEFLLALALMCEAVMVRAGSMQDIGDGQIEIGMVWPAAPSARRRRR